VKKIKIEFKVYTVQGVTILQAYKLSQKDLLHFA